MLTQLSRLSRKCLPQSPPRTHLVRAMSSHRGPQKMYHNEVSVNVQEGVALITFVGTEGELPWGTKRAEHRWNPVTVQALNDALDAAEADEAVHAVVVTNEGKFWSNGMDLKFMDTADEAALKEIGPRVNQLLARVCCFPLPTIAALNGHWCAAGGMMGLAFDYRVMSSDKGFFFIPGIDLGLVYAPMQVALMKAKLPQDMHREVILFNTKRWVGPELAARGIVDAAVPSSEVVPKALEMAAALVPKGRGPARKALSGIKHGVYKEVVDAVEQGGDMGYEGRVKGVDRAAPPLASNL